MQSHQRLKGLIALLSLEENYIKAVQSASKKYNFEQNELRLLSPAFVLQQFDKIQSEDNSPSVVPNQNQQLISNFLGENWSLNEGKIFSWIVVCYFYSINKEIEAYDSVDLAFLCSIFPKKHEVFIQFNLLSLLKQGRSKRETWSEQELNLLKQLTSQQKYREKWKLISYVLFCRSEKKYFRTSHKCREKWFNYLNPVVRHQKWTIQEDCELFRHAGEYGEKWAKISKAMNEARTVDMVKNRYNSIVKRFGSRFPRCSNKKIIERIGELLQGKLLNQKQIATSEKGNEQVLVKIETRSENSEQQKRNKSQPILPPQKYPKSESESSEEDCGEHKKACQIKVSEGVQEQKREGIYILIAPNQLTDLQKVLGKTEDVLKDYSNMDNMDQDFQNKRTYFSGNLQ